MAIGLTPLHFLVVLVIAVIVAAPIVLLVALLVAFRRRSEPDPRAILAARLARGEITREEFDTAMRALGFAPPSSGWGPPPGGPSGPGA